MRPLALLVLLTIATTAHAQVAVVNNGVRDVVDREHLRNILLGRVTTWKDGSLVVVVLSSDPASRAAIEELTGRDLERLLRGWKRILFSGNGAMPLVMSGSNEALDFVAHRAGAIAIVGTTPSTERQGVRIAVPLSAQTPR